MFLNRKKKHNVYPCKPQFYYIKVGFKGSILYRHVFMNVFHISPTAYFFFFFEKKNICLDTLCYLLCCVDSEQTNRCAGLPRS